MKKYVQAAVFLAGLAVLSGCDRHKTVDVKNAAPADVASKAADAGMHFVPGSWETTVSIKDFSVEGMPPEMAAAMKQAMAQRGSEASKTRTCLTPEKAAKPDSGFFGKHNKECVYKDFSMGSGKIAGTLTCSEHGGSQTMTMDGTYTPDSYTMDMKMTGNQDGKAMTTHIVAVAHHVGDCGPQDDKN